MIDILMFNVGVSSVHSMSDNPFVTLLEQIIGFQVADWKTKGKGWRIYDIIKVHFQMVGFFFY